jgi:cell cycle sensor histidine kinase DivJ
VFLSESLERTIATMVHPDRRADPAERFAHQTFIAARLCVSAAALALAPAHLALFGAPSGPVAAAFAFLTLPMAAAFLASREGRLERAELAHLSGLFGAVASLAVWGPAPAAVVWLAAAPFDAASVFGRRGAWLVGACAALVAVAAGVLANATASAASLAGFLVPALLYVGAVTAARGRERARREQSAASTQTRLRQLTQTVEDLSVGCDRSGSVIFSALGARSFGLSSRDVAGRGLFERVHVADRPAFLHAVAFAAAGQTRAACVRLRLPASDGEAPVFGWAELRAQPCACAQEPALAAILVARDVTEIKRREEELERLRAEAERANQMKDRFLANVSHELRTPLNAIIGFSDLLRSNASMEAGRRVDYAEVIHDAGAHLLDMVNSLLDMSKIEAGRYELTTETVALAGLVEQVSNMMRLRAEQAGVALTVELDPGLGEIVADGRACRQILTNLVANAVKFTGEGGSVRLTARRENAGVVFDVADTGVGIRADDLSRLGDAFFQASSAHDRAHEGAGLGLSLVRGLVGLHGGEIRVESAPGEGTQVTVRLPFDRPEPYGEPVRIHAFPRAQASAARPGAGSALDAPHRMTA